MRIGSAGQIVRVGLLTLTSARISAGNQVIDPHMTRLLSVGGGTDVKRRASLKNVNQYQIRTIGTPMS